MPIQLDDPGLAVGVATAPAPATREALTTGPLTVLVADDHPLFRRGVARAIARYEGLTLVGEALDGDEAIELIDALEPDVAVLDHRMPGRSGVEVAVELAARPRPPATAVLILSAFEDADLVAAAHRAGASGHLGKTASQGEVCRAIEHVGRGGRLFPPGLA